MRRVVVSRSSRTSLMGLAVGVAAGLAAGLLVAPARGSETRSSLAQRASVHINRWRSLAESGRTWLDDTLQQSGAALDQSRKAFARNRAVASNQPLTASLGDVAATHTSSSAEVS
jgi:gas vesicle protein